MGINGSIHLVEWCSAHCGHSQVRWRFFPCLLQSSNPNPARDWGETGESQPKRMWLPTRNRNALRRAAPLRCSLRGQDTSHPDHIQAIRTTTWPQPHTRKKCTYLSKPNETPKHSTSKQTVSSSGEAGPGQSPDTGKKAILFSPSRSGWRQALSLGNFFEIRFLWRTAAAQHSLGLGASFHCPGFLFTKRKSSCSRTQIGELGPGEGGPKKIEGQALCVLYPHQPFCQSCLAQTECPSLWKPYRFRMTRWH